MIPRTPIPTLFPYTTLFRSQTEARDSSIRWRSRANERASLHSQSLPGMRENLLSSPRKMSRFRVRRGHGRQNISSNRSVEDGIQAASQEEIHIQLRTLGTGQGALR